MTTTNIYKMPQNALKMALFIELNKYYSNTVIKDGFLYAEGSHPTMLVAHLDTVHKDCVKTICTTTDGDIWMSPEGIGGDDRNGVYMILKIVETLTAQNKALPHILFTEDEEIGGKGANKFLNHDIKPELNFIIEFDRAGDNDAVYYDCDNPEFEKFISTFGFKTEMGSYSDISTIAPYLKVAAVNLSSGYHNPHTKHEYIVFSEMHNNINRALQIIEAGTTKYEYIESNHIKWTNYYSSNWDNWYNDIISRHYDTTAKKSGETQATTFYRYLDCEGIIIPSGIELVNTDGTFVSDGEKYVLTDTGFICILTGETYYGTPVMMESDIDFMNGKDLDMLYTNSSEWDWFLVCTDDPYADDGSGYYYG